MFIYGELKISLKCVGNGIQSSVIGTITSFPWSQSANCSTNFVLRANHIATSEAIVALGRGLTIVSNHEIICLPQKVLYFVIYTIISMIKPRSL